MFDRLPPEADFRPDIDVPDIEKFVMDAIETVTNRELDVRDKKGRWYSLRVRPYRTRENRIEGAVIILLDIDHHKRDIEELSKVRDCSDQGWRAWSRGRPPSRISRRPSASRASPRMPPGSTS